MNLPKQLEALRERRVWVCYPLIWNEKKHNGVGGYDKPPINPYTLYNGATDNPESLATYDVAAAQIGKTARVRLPRRDGLVECTVAGVGIAFSGTGVAGIDFDNVVDSERRVMTHEAGEIVKTMSSYTEVSPSGTGLHVIFLGKLPEGIKKLAADKKDAFGTERAEYQLFDSGYIAISGNVVFDYELAERTAQVAEVYEKYFREVEPIATPSSARPRSATGSSPVVSSDTGYTRERWLFDVRRLSDAEILDRIFASGRTGEAVKRLYDGDTSDYSNDHSRADLALCTFLYGFTDDRELTERLFRSSRLYRAKGKSRTYLERTLTRAASECKPLIGHIVFTDAEKKAYAQKKEAEEKAAGKDRYGSFLRDRARKRGN